MVSAYGRSRDRLLRRASRIQRVPLSESDEKTLLAMCLFTATFIVLIYEVYSPLFRLAEPW